MATRAPQTSSNRQGNYGSNGAGGSNVDVGHAAIARMAREDTRWFVVAVVILSLVLFLALPLSLLVLVETAKMKSEIQWEVKQLKKFKQEVRDRNEKAAATKPAPDPDGL